MASRGIHESEVTEPSTRMLRDTTVTPLPDAALPLESPTLQHPQFGPVRRREIMLRRKIFGQRRKERHNARRRLETEYLAFSGDHDDLDADRVIGALCPRVPGRNRDFMLLGGECHECVIDGATCDAQAAERVRQFPGPRPAQQ